MRISGGDARGIRLKVPSGARPAPERVRQAVFSSLAAALPEARVLDLYCGSGAYGLEALSRGAAEAVFVDRTPAAIQAVRANARSTGCDHLCRFERRDVIAFLAGPGGRGHAFDLIFADPPYASPEAVAETIGTLAGAAAPGARAVIECRWSGSPVAGVPGWVLEADRRYGDTRVLVWRRTGDGG